MHYTRDQGYVKLQVNLQKYVIVASAAIAYQDTAIRAKNRITIKVASSDTRALAGHICRAVVLSKGPAHRCLHV